MYMRITALFEKFGAIFESDTQEWSASTEHDMLLQVPQKIEPNIV